MTTCLSDIIKPTTHRPNGLCRWPGTRIRAVLAAMLAFIAVLPAADASYMLAKAGLAQLLIKRSWSTTAESPWPWADTSPVARLVIPDLAVDNYVLDGATGATLAFGPGLVSGSARPGSPGVAMIAAHRDTHFEPLHRIKTGTLVKIQNTDKQWHKYRVSKISIADSTVDSFSWLNHKAQLVLVTCYPFDALVPGGPLRYVVEANLIDR